MDKNLDLLNKARATFSCLVIEVGIQYLQALPRANLDEFIATFMPSLDGIRSILKKEKLRLKSERNEKLKFQRKVNQTLGWFCNVGQIVPFMNQSFHCFLFF